MKKLLSLLLAIALLLPVGAMAERFEAEGEWHPVKIYSEMFVAMDELPRSFGDLPEAIWKDWNIRVPLFIEVTDDAWLLVSRHYDPRRDKPELMIYPMFREDGQWRCYTGVHYSPIRILPETAEDRVERFSEFFPLDQYIGALALSRVEEIPDDRFEFLSPDVVLLRHSDTRHDSEFFQGVPSLLYVRDDLME